MFSTLLSIYTLDSQSRLLIDETSEASLTSTPRDLQRFPAPNQMSQSNVESSSQFSISDDRPSQDNNKWNMMPSKNIWTTPSTTSFDNDDRNSQSNQNMENSRNPQTSQSFNTNNPTNSQPSRDNGNRVPQNPQFNQNFMPPTNVNREDKKPEETSHRPTTRKHQLVHTYDSNPVYTPNQKVAIDIEYPTENYSSDAECKTMRRASLCLSPFTDTFYIILDTTRKPLRRPQITKKPSES